VRRASAPCFIVSATAIAFSLSFASADEFGVATYYHNPRYGGLIAAHLRLPSEPGCGSTISTTAAT